MNNPTPYLLRDMGKKDLLRTALERVKNEERRDKWDTKKYRLRFVTLLTVERGAA